LQILACCTEGMPGFWSSSGESGRQSRYLAWSVAIRDIRSAKLMDLGFFSFYVH
jgi:hypothetical protein